MAEKIKSIAANIVSNVVASVILYIVVGLGTSCALLWSSVKIMIAKLGETTLPLNYWIILITSFIVAVVCIISVIIYIIKRCNRPNFPKIAADVRCESAISELYFENREKIFCSREVNIEIVCEKKESIVKQFTWTGSECRGTILEKANGDYLLIDFQRKKPPYGYEVKFNLNP